MKHPIWMINSSLLIILIAIGIFVYFQQQPIPSFPEIEAAVAIPITDTVSSVNSEKIWSHDLFDTYQKPVQEPQEFVAPQLPPPPSPAPIVIPELPTPQFLDPLDVTLKGIVLVTNNDELNRAMVVDNKTSTEGTYKVGDQIEDAQLIKIMSNKVIFIRSNGQQEVLYLREKDARKDPAYAVIGNWAEVVRKIAEDRYVVNGHLFSQRVTSLAQFIDMLDITTVYRQGMSIGCRIGTIAPDSLGYVLGLEKGDIILAVNGISTGDTANRFAIYKLLTTLKPDSTVSIELQRANQELTLTYTLKNTLPARPSTPASPASTPKEGAVPPTPTPAVPAQPVLPAPDPEQQRKILEEQHKLAPTLKEIRARERNNMQQYGALSYKRPVYKLTGTSS
jgi:type II secretion system protein C